MKKYYLRVLYGEKYEDIVIEADRLDTYSYHHSFIEIDEIGKAQLKCCYPINITIITKIEKI